MKHTLLTFLTALMLAPISALHAAESKPTRPNILIILSDDQGYCELGSFMDIASADTLGAPLAAKYRAIKVSTDNEAPIEVCFEAARKCTPNLDALANGGMKFTQFYAAPTCAPSRAALMSGRYPQSFGIYTNTDVVVEDKGVSPEVKFPVKLFQQAGYMTGLTGKWHLGNKQPGQHPNDRGFDYYFGFDIAATPKYNSKWLYRNREKTPAVGWLADQTTDEAVAFLDRSHQEQKPFFLYVAYNEPHGPTERPPQTYIDYFKSGSDTVDVHFGTIYGMDQGIGRILAELQRTGRMENTLIIFASDNGIAQLTGFSGKKGNYHAPVPGAGPLRGGKWTPWEGGVRVPAIVHVPGGASKTSAALASIIDVIPTALDYAGIKVPTEYPLDGRSLLPILKGQSTGDSERTLFWACDAQEPFGDWNAQHLALKDTLRANSKAHKDGHVSREDLFPPAWYVRTSQWKLMGWDSLAPVLIDMIADPYEYKDVAAQHPDVVKKLHRQFHTWLQSQPPPQTYSHTLYEKMLPSAHAHEHLSPHQRAILDSKSPAAEEYRFSFDLPAGPQFSEADKEAQRVRGGEVMPMVMKAFENGAESVRIPPGDYRFGQERWQGAKVIYPLGFEEMQRDAEHPFVIDATGATFWFDLDDKQMPPGHRCVGFRNCRNIVLRGAIIDRGTRGCIEGRITRIDREGNRFEIQPSPGVVVPTSYKGADEQRLFPFKSDGRFCVPLYDMQAGVRKLRYKDITPSDGGRYWINMLEPQLMERLHDANWERAYGDLGVVRVGDGLSCLYTGAGAIVLDDSANITLHGVSVYVAKGGPSESGGDGAHLWKDCYFGPRPGTSQWKGADGFLCRSTRYGCVMDNVTIRHTADDLQNFHGIWGKVKSVSGKQVTLETNGALLPTLRNARPGDRLRFIHRKNGALLGEAKLISHHDYQLTLDQDATPFAEAQAEWLDHECAGWVVQNCRWEDNFQRLLIMSGPGLVRGCTFTRMGSNISLNTGMGLVGGIPSDITIADNTFTDVSSRPHGAIIDSHAHNAQGKDGIPPIEHLVITGNTFTRSGGPAMNLIGLQDSLIENNVIDSPVRATVIAKPDVEAARQAILLRYSTRVALKSNTLTDPEAHTRPAPASDSPLLGLEATKEITLDGQRFQDVPKTNPKAK